ncbi:MAG: isoleucine--tRNA ligase [Sphingomicrobium sp.]
MSDSPDTPPTKPDWRSTVFLPKTDFPMKAGLPQKEPAILAKWQADGAYQQLRKARAGAEKFILHDGPPYANGDIHIGHALNHILKDMVVRTQTLLGKDAPYVPGWDCHGLPIEWKVEEQYRKKKLDKDQVPLPEFRAECRAYAQGWVDTQREQLKRLGIGGDWDNPYLTMDFAAEATIVGELMKFAETGQLYRGAKPVMWSPVEKTALAEAEIEYEDVTSTQIDVAFEIVESKSSALQTIIGNPRWKLFGLIWTTTPWTIPVNQAVAYGPEVNYVVIPEGGSVNHYLVAEPLAASFLERCGDKIPGIFSLHESEWAVVKGSDLAGTVARHPMHHLGGFFARPRPFLPGEFVTTETGTGLVHMAPDHGEDDFALCKANGIEPVFAVEGDGKYGEDWAWLGGQGSVINTKFNAPDGPICSDLREAGALLAASDFRHSYPHSWRSKARVIYRCTPQWFIGMDSPLPDAHIESFAEKRWDNEGGALGHGPTLRQLAVRAIAETRFVPEKGRNRIGSMVEGRPDWVISRQRAWGVPIALFVERGTNTPLVDRDVNTRIVAGVKALGVDAWNDERAAEYLGPDRDSADYERVTDILDVWFDSGCTHAFVLESGKWPGMRSPADLYLEGSDQHRGWFQSSLLESCGTRGHAPYKAVLTHGFTMDQKGMKMSKSLGNTVNPLDLMRDYGADILRLWALSVDFTEDHRIGKEILSGVADQYRKLRNTFRYLLGALEGFGDQERVQDVSTMPELERYMLTRLFHLDVTLKGAVEAFDFNLYVRALSDFCNEELSALYFDIRKDVLYCEVNAETGEQTDARRSYRTVLDTLFNALIRYAAPVLVFTSEEVWTSRYPERDSVHLLEWPDIDDRWNDPMLDDRFQPLLAARRDINDAIEPLRREKTVRSSLEADVTYPVAKFASAMPGGAVLDLIALAEFAIVSRVTEGDALHVAPTANHKCGRCWRHLPEVTEDGDLCRRCESVVNAN